MNDNIISIYDENNQKQKIKVLKYFTLDMNNKDYIIYYNVDDKHRFGKFPTYLSEIINKEDSFYMNKVEDETIVNHIKDLLGVK